MEYDAEGSVSRGRRCLYTWSALLAASSLFSYPNKSSLSRVLPLPRECEANAAEVFNRVLLSA